MGNFGLQRVPRPLTLNLTLKVNFHVQTDLGFEFSMVDLTLSLKLWPNIQKWSSEGHT